MKPITQMTNAEQAQYIEQHPKRDAAFDAILAAISGKRWGKKSNAALRKAIEKGAAQEGGGK